MRRLIILFAINLLNNGTTRCFSQGLPIKPARTLSFTTDEGTYMNVDVSPDGHTILFDLLGDLYSVPVTGGDATQLTRGIALHLRPVWSPDGKKIAYLSDGSGTFQLNVMDLGGKFYRVLGRRDKEVFYGLDPVWMPDGAYIHLGAIVYGLAGGEMSSRLSIKNPIRFSPDGKLAYSLDSGKIYSYDQTTKKRTALSSDLNRFQRGILSPDARWWCYLTDSNGNQCLIARNLTTDTSRILVSAMIENDPRYLQGVPSPHFSFSPDSKTVFIGYAGKIHRIDVEDGSNRIISFVARVKSDLGPYDYHTFRIFHDSAKVRYTRSANISPDGKLLTFCALDKVYVMDLPHGKPHVLTCQSMGQFQPVYSPDGQWIAYTSWDDTSGGYLWRVPASGGQPQKLTSIPGVYQRPAWSLDGTLIAVVRGAPNLGGSNGPETGCLELIPVNGGPVRTIDDSVPLMNLLGFSPDGHRIVYTPNSRHGSRNSLIPQLVAKQLDGPDLQVITVGRYTDFPYCQQESMSPDGRFIVYSAAEDLYLVPVCKLTEPMVINDDGRLPSAIRFASGVDPYWEQGGKELAWTYGNRFYRINPDKIITVAERTSRQREAAASLEDDFVTVAVAPDEVITINITAPGLYAHGIMALKNVRIITMQGNKVIENGTIVIRGGRITAVGPSALIVVPSGAKLFDLAGKTVIPGLVDLHLHMRTPSDIFPQQSWMYLINLAYGVTTARDPASIFDSFGYAELLRSGQMTGPRLYTVGHAVRFNDGVIRFDNPEDARAVVSKRARFGATVVKNYLPTSPRIKREWLLIACREAGLNMTNEGWYDPMMQLAMIKDGSTGVEHNPFWGDVYGDVISFVAASQIYFTPTLQVSSTNEMGKEYFKYKYWHQPDEKLRRFMISDTMTGSTRNGAESVEEIAKACPVDTVNPSFITPALLDARIRKMGGQVTLGSHGNDEGIGAHNELWALQMGGLDNMEALRAGTIMGAEALGVQHDIGSIVAGKIADLVILNKNPLEDIHNSREIRYVMKDGILYDGNTLDMIWPMAKKCPEWKLRLH